MTADSGSPRFLDLFEEPAVVDLTPRQRNFVARKVIASLQSARANRERLLAKYPDEPDVTRSMDSAIHSLTGLGIKIGLTTEDMATPITETRRRAR